MTQLQIHNTTDDIKFLDKTKIHHNVFQTLCSISSSHNYNSWLYKNIKDHLKGHVIDIGSGLGDIAQYYSQSQIDSLTLTDYSDQMVSFLESKFAHIKNYRSIKMDISCEHDGAELPVDGMDTATCINVLEHIEDDVGALNNIYRLLNDNGRLVLIVPALSGLYGTLDSLVGHYRRYDKSSLRKIIGQTPFVISQERYMNIFGIISWFISGKILKLRHFNERSCRALDKIVPLLEKFESVIPPPWGQSLITVCSKIKK